jgi:hypothetical protein
MWFVLARRLFVRCSYVMAWTFSCLADARRLLVTVNARARTKSTKQAWCGSGHPVLTTVGVYALAMATAIVLMAETKPWNGVMMAQWSVKLMNSPVRTVSA